MMKRKILIAVAGVLMAGLVFSVLMLSRQKLDYAGASAYVSDILVAEEVIFGFLEGEVGELDDGVRELAVEFDETAGRISEYYVSLGASSAMKNDEVRAKYEELGPMMGSELGARLLPYPPFESYPFEEMEMVARWLAGYMGGEWGEMGETAPPNDFLRGMVADMEAHTEKVEAFEEKYGNGKADDYNKMTEEYGVILAEGEVLEKKYAGVALKDIVGVSIDEVRGWFEILRQLQSILEEKK